MILGLDNGIARNAWYGKGGGDTQDRINQGALGARAPGPPTKTIMF